MTAHDVASKTYQALICARIMSGLQVTYDEPLSNNAFNCHVRRYHVDAVAPRRTRGLQWYGGSG
jgi:hypothetical protein